MSKIGLKQGGDAGAGAAAAAPAPAKKAAPAKQCGGGGGGGGHGGGGGGHGGGKGKKHGTRASDIPDDEFDAEVGYVYLRSVVCLEYLRSVNRPRQCTRST